MMTGSKSLTELTGPGGWLKIVNDNDTEKTIIFHATSEKDVNKLKEKNKRTPNQQLVNH